jgi:hypothetical protein
MMHSFIRPNRWLNLLTTLRQPFNAVFAAAVVDSRNLHSEECEGKYVVHIVVSFDVSVKPKILLETDSIV